MDTPGQTELINLLMELDPMDQADVLQFVRVRLAARIINLRPPNAYEWSQLTAWQKMKIRYAVFFQVARSRAAKYIRSRLSQWKGSITS